VSFGGECVQGGIHDVHEGVVVGEVVADAEEPGEGVGALEGEADEAGVVVGIEALRARAGGGAGDDHALQATKGDADDEDLLIEGGADSALVQAGEVVGVEGAGVETVGEAVTVARRRAHFAARVGGAEGWVGIADGPGTAAGDGTGRFVWISWHVSSSSQMEGVRFRSPAFRCQG
jgi:hypothetical protein